MFPKLCGERHHCTRVLPGASFQSVILAKGKNHEKKQRDYLALLKKKIYMELGPGVTKLKCCVERVNNT